MLNLVIFKADEGIDLLLKAINYVRKYENS
jgi:hypothetical protein